MINNASKELESIQTVALEFLRPGPAHGQLLSPLTQYIALCGDEGPVTFRIEIEHWKLLNSLHRLRYVVKGPGRKKIEVVPERIRQSEVRELGDEVGRILKDIPTLATELGRAAGRLGTAIEDGSGFVHLRLITSGSELSLIPFELMTSPEGYPGDGIAMTLQSRMPVIVTREVRRGRPSSIDWNRRPKILVVIAAPEELYVPQRAHVHAIRRAVDPWVWWGDKPIGEKPLKNVKHLVTVVVNASVEDIERKCREREYSHVHILAHGDSYEEAGQLRYGLAMHDDSDRNRKRVVNGRRIAGALLVGRRGSNRRSRPLFVSLATCDSGNVRSVAVPGGSIAHDLHAEGIPWVLASQFPLTMAGSVRMTEFVYSGLLLGEDPRRLFCRLRTSMYVAGKNDHDWASLVAYASVPHDLGEQVSLFRNEQMRRAMETEFNEAQKATDKKDWKKTKAAIAKAHKWIERWKEGLPTGNSRVEKGLRGECYGVSGAIDKRAAELYRLRPENAEPEPEGSLTVEQLLQRARRSYQSAMKLGLFEQQHWPATQFLSLTAVLGEPEDRDAWVRAVAWAKEDLERPESRNRAWGHGTLAELEMLQLYHDPGGAEDRDTIKESVVRHCRAIVDLEGKGSFPVFSTKRQFERYVGWWQNEMWDDFAKAAVEELSRI